MGSGCADGVDELTPGSLGFDRSADCDAIRVAVAGLRGLPPDRSALDHLVERGNRDQNGAVDRQLGSVEES